MDPIHQILQRQAHQIQPDAWLLGVPATVQSFDPVQQYFVTTFDANAAQQWHKHDVNLGWIAPEKNRKQVILFYPKAKQETLMLLDWAIAHLSLNGGILWIVGENKGGIKSAAAVLQSRDLKGSKIDSARHCAIFEVDVLAATQQKTVVLAQFELQTALPNGITLSSYPGVFSAGRLDIGTALLLQYLTKIKGPVLDFGCGCGVIGTHILQKQQDAVVDFIDVSWLATQATLATLTKNNYPHRHIMCSDGFPKPAESYHHVVSNPPFHQGIRTQYEVTERFIKDAKNNIRIGGDLTLVANQFLNYEPILTQSFGNCIELGRSQGFKILYAKRDR